jgi:hypothetical protein
MDFFFFLPFFLPDFFGILAEGFGEPKNNEPQLSLWVLILLVLGGVLSV